MKAGDFVDKKTGRYLRQFELITKTCKCGNTFEVAEWRLIAGRGKYCSKACFFKYRKVHSKETHYKWKGVKAKYSAVHKYIQAHYGKPKVCEWCGFTSDNTYQFHWANLTGKYLRERSDWARLCAKCHWHYDRATK